LELVKTINKRSRIFQKYINSATIIPTPTPRPGGCIGRKAPVHRSKGTLAPRIRGYIGPKQSPAPDAAAGVDPAAPALDGLEGGAGPRPPALPLAFGLALAVPVESPAWNTWESFSLVSVLWCCIFF